ncbi:hypothetical protein KCV26_15955 [Petrimonas sulfuriphila]|mgnify:CR=1 FL=1|jgi:hypothetical protein|uniref:hypothetical protein n=1 Tax=Petrimonas sulfuriphila TaxID=285070 RepID=UPI00324B3B58
MKKIIFGIVLVLLTTSFQVMAQDMITNQDIISMKSAKIGDDVILTKITSSQCDFDLSMSGLIDLKNAKISDNIIKQMLISSPPNETITNEDIIGMYKAKISNSIIKDKMLATNHQYDVSSNGLIDLTTAKVPKDVVKLMIEEPQGKGNIMSLQNINNEKRGFFDRRSNNTNRETDSRVAPIEYTFNHTVVEDCPIPEFSLRPYFFSNETLKSMERADASIDVKVVAFGYGGSEVFYTVFPSQSNSRFGEGKIAPIIVKVENDSDPSEIFYLVKAKEVKKDRRRFIMSKMSMGGKGADLSEFVIQIEFRKIKDNIYQILVPDNLQPGEYGFMPISSKKEATTIKITCFGID